jgi:hypothetical protein
METAETRNSTAKTAVSSLSRARRSASGKGPLPMDGTSSAGGVDMSRTQLVKMDA